MLRNAHLHTVIFASLLTGAVGCASPKVAFLHGYRSPGRLEANHLKKLQFYVSQDIVLRREVDTSEHTVTADHAYRSVDGQLVEQIYLPAGTPGLVAGVEGDKLLVSFEPGATLPFQHLPKVKGEAPETYRFPYRNGRTVLYRGKPFTVLEGGLESGDDAILLVEAEWEERFEHQRRTLRGRRIAERAP